MNVRDLLGVLHSFSIESILFDKMDFRLFFFKWRYTAHATGAFTTHRVSYVHFLSKMIFMIKWTSGFMKKELADLWKRTLSNVFSYEILQHFLQYENDFYDRMDIRLLYFCVAIYGSYHCSFSILPENIRKSEIFWYFQGGEGL